MFHFGWGRRGNMNKKKMISGIKFMFKKAGVEIDRIDFSAEVDSSLSISENYRVLKEKYVEDSYKP